MKLNKFYPISKVRILEILGKYYGQVGQDKKIIMAFRDPGGIYENLFDGFRDFIEPILYVSSTFNINTIPDWYFIAENNVVGSLDSWVSNSEDIKKMVSKYEYPDFIEFRWENELTSSAHQHEFLNFSYHAIETISYREVLLEQMTDCSTPLPVIVIWRHR